MTHYRRTTLQISILTNFLCILTSQSTEYRNETLLINSSIQHKTVFRTVRPLICPPCEQIHCYKNPELNLQCKGGYTVGVCGCCKACAKLESELCGGDHDYLGKCDVGLECEPQPAREFSIVKGGVKQIHIYNSGICKLALKKEIPTKLFSIKCKPLCSPMFCNKNPRAICSARENAEFSQECQGDCQHTSCRACRFITKEDPCIKCAANNLKCIREFGRCFRKKVCKPKQYPCGSLKAVKREKGDFACVVPSCLY